MKETRQASGQQNPVLLRTEQAQAMLNIGRPMLFKLIADGELRSVKMGRLRLIPVEAIQELIDRRLEVESEKRFRKRELGE